MGYITFAGSQTLGGSGTVMFGDYPSAAVNALRLADGGTTLTMGLGITVEGQNGTIGYSSAWGGPQNVSVVNQGVISADVSGGTISIQAQPFTNQGLAQGANGGSLIINELQNNPGGTLIINGGGSLSLNGVWTNAGAINVTNSTVNLGGSFTLATLGALTRSGGTVNLTGTLDNRSTTLALTEASGSWVLDGGTVLGGTITTAGGATLLVNNGTLDGVTLAGTLDVGNTVNGAELTVTNGLVLNGTALVGNPTNSTYGVVSFAGSQTLGGSGTVMFGDYPSAAVNALRLADGGTTLTMGLGITVEGQNGTIGYSSAWGGPQNVSVVNQGVISANVSGGTIALTPQSFSNQGTVAALQGIVTANAGFVAAGGTLAVGLGSSTSYGQIQISGNAALGGTLSVSLLGVFVPAISNSFAVVTYNSFRGSFATLDLPVALHWQATYGATAFSLLVTGISTTTNLPVLTIGHVNTNTVVILWPTAAGNFTLQTSTNLSSGIWSNVVSGITAVGADYVLTNAVNGEAAFFRLQSQ